MRVATVRAFAVFVIALALAVVATRLHDFIAAVEKVDFDLVVEREAGSVLAVLVLMVIGVAAGLWLLRHAGAATRKFTAAAVVIVAASLTIGMRGLEPTAISSLSPRQREAFEYLRNAEDFEMPFVGFGGVRSRGYLAMRILQRSVAADEAFGELVRNGTTAGQMYGLCGLYETNPLKFAATLPPYRRSAATVGVFDGCVLGGRKVAEVACSSNGMRIPRGVSLDDWWRANHERAAFGEADICGGALPAVFRQRDHDEAAARLDERRVKFWRLP